MTPARRPSPRLLAPALYLHCPASAGTAAGIVSMACCTAIIFTNHLADSQKIRSHDRMKPRKVDQIDARILLELQRDAGLSQRDLAERVGLSQNACWRRLRALEEEG